jgi:hypothetical protein
LRGVFYPSGTSYFGFTKDNNGTWSNAPGATCISYFKIAQTDLGAGGTWSGTLAIKPDINNAFYNGPGEYLFKVGRYTQSCGSPLWSTETTIAITGPTPTLTAAPTTTGAPASTSTPTPKLTPTLTPKPTQQLSPTTPDNSLATSEGVLGDSSNSGEIQNPTIQPKELKIASESKNNLLPKFLIFIGIVFLLACVIVFSYPYFKEFIRKHTNEQTSNNN